MAQKLYKWTGSITSPDAYDSQLSAPQWYGYNDSGVGLAYLDTTFAGQCSSSNDDFAATTAAEHKTWVKSNSRQAAKLNKQCREEIRASYSIEDELKAYRTDDSDVKTAIGKIVDSYTAKKNALVGD
tara:strand:- start:624 stop:1004 length:381 start_codon:yes stop_codon:yes gene_type:complete